MIFGSLTDWVSNSCSISSSISSSSRYVVNMHSRRPLLWTNPLYHIEPMELIDFARVCVFIAPFAYACVRIAHSRAVFNSFSSSQFECLLRFTYRRKCKSNYYSAAPHKFYSRASNTHSFIQSVYQPWSLHECVCVCVCIK